MNVFLFVAREKNGDLYLYAKYPSHTPDAFEAISSKSDFDRTYIPNFKLEKELYFTDRIQIDSNLFPSVTFENSPKKVFF